MNIWNESVQMYSEARKNARLFKNYLIISLLLFSITFSNPYLNTDKIIIKNKTPEISNQISTNANQVRFIEKGFFDDDCGIELESLGVIIKGDFVYIANDYQGLEILNISNPNKPFKIASKEIPGSARDLFLTSNNIMFVAHSSGVVIFDVNEPNNPIELSKITLPGVKEVAIRSNLLYIATGFNGFYLYEVSDPEEPLFISSWKGSYEINGIAVISKFVCLATDGGLEIIDLTFPSRPFKGGFWNNITNIASGVAVAEISEQKFAFVAFDHGGLMIINFTLPNSPYLIGEYTDNRVIDCIKWGNYVFCATYLKGLDILDITDVVNPFKIGSYDTEGECVDVSTKGSITVLADSKKGIAILNTNSKETPILYSTFFDQGEATRITMHDQYAFVVDVTPGLEIFDVSNPEHPEKILLFDNDQESLNVKDVVLMDNLAVISAFDNGLFFLEISDPENPILLNNYFDGYWPQRAIIRDDLAFVGTFNDTLLVLNISDINSISVEGSYTFPADSGVESLILVDDILYVGAYFLGIYCLNISDISNITLFDFEDDKGGALDFEKRDNYLITADGSAGIIIYDISSYFLEEIVVLNTTGVARELVLYEDFIFVAESSQGLAVINISDISTPERVGRFSKYTIKGVGLYQQFLVIGSSYDGTRILILDSDGDSLTDFDEINIYNTDPYDADTDDDLAPDGFEILYGFDPLNSEDGSEDPDLDDLSNAAESYYNTHPLNNDTDSDRMNDGYEVEFGLDPLIDDADLDKDIDHLTNLEEYLLGTNPRDRDTDDDEYLDGVEVIYGTDPFDEKDNPKTRFIKRIISASVIITIIIIISIIFLVKTIKIRIARNREREKMLLEEEEQILVF